MGAMFWGAAHRRSLAYIHPKTITPTLLASASCSLRIETLQLSTSARCCDSRMDCCAASSRMRRSEWPPVATYVLVVRVYT